MILIANKIKITMSIHLCSPVTSICGSSTRPTHAHVVEFCELLACYGLNTDHSKIKLATKLAIKLKLKSYCML